MREPGVVRYDPSMINDKGRDIVSMERLSTNTDETRLRKESTRDALGQYGMAGLYPGSPPGEEAGNRRIASYVYYGNVVPVIDKLPSLLSECKKTPMVFPHASRRQNHERP